MQTPGSKSNTVAFPNLKLSNAEAATARELVDVRLQLSNLLQTTLELPRLIEIFFDAIKQELNIGSLSYRNAAINNAIDLGKHAQHSCHYQLVTQRDSLGEITFTRRKRFAEEELERLEALIGCLICPMRNALLYREALQNALRDPLTGAGNRSAMETTLEREVALAHRNQCPLTMMVIDIDHFKQVNDQYGHTAGDCVLKDVAKTLANCSRETDSTYHAYRFGGEEFVLLLNNTSTQGAMIVADRVRQSIESMSTNYLDREIQVTASIGISSIKTDDNESTLFARADKALYQAKNSGRNCVVSDDAFEQ